MSPEEWHLALSSLWPITSGALRGTLPLALLSFAGGMPIAIAVALMRIFRRAILARLGGGFVSVVRGTPLFVQLFVVFYGLPRWGSSSTRGPAPSSRSR